MRSYPHNPKEAIADKHRVHLLSVFKPDSVLIDAAPATSEEWIWSENAERGLFLARYAYAFEEPVETVRQYLERSNSSFSTGLERRSPFDLGALMQQLAAAVVVRNTELASRLCTLEHARYQVDGSTFIPAVQREFDVWQMLILGRRDEALARLVRAEAGLQAERLPRAAMEECAPMLALLRAVLTADEAALNQALFRRADAIEKIYATPSARQDPQALLDLRGLALAALARRHGLNPVTDSVYLPLSIAVS